MDYIKFYHIRNLLGFTQKELANNLNISTRQLRQYENGKLPINENIAIKMEDHLKPIKHWTNL
jgi:transcriptional regulator with XRE-family HTH domain